jgi:hypothetical protein
MRFLKLIGCDNGKVGSYAALVKERNDTAHTNGNIFFSTQAALDTKIREILRVVDEIQTHSVPTIQRCYARFLDESNSPDDREYSEDADQIREVLIHAHYLSQRDIEICAAFDWRAQEKLEMHTNAPGIGSLHQTLRATYTEPEPAAIL